MSKHHNQIELMLKVMNQSCWCQMMMSQAISNKANEPAYYVIPIVIALSAHSIPK